MSGSVLAVALLSNLLSAGSPGATRTGDNGSIAGSYYRGDGLGVNWNLTLTAAGTFSFTWDGCLGRYDENDGEAVLDGSTLTLRPHRPLDQGMAKQLPLAWVVVPWGPRTYLLEQADIPLFAKYVNQGWEPRSAIYGPFLLRREDWKKPARGLPTLPATWSRLVLAKPITARISRPLDGGRAEIDRGSSHGLVVGMLLTAVRGDEWIDVTVRSVASGRSVVEAEDGRDLTTKHHVSSRP